MWILPRSLSGRRAVFASTSLAQRARSGSSGFESLNKSLRPRGTRREVPSSGLQEERHMNSVIYLIGLVVVVLAILSFLGLS